MKVEQLYFESGSQKLFGALFIPDFPESNIGYVICHPFFEEKKSSQRTLVDMSQALSKSGYFVFMFDFFGCGDSEGFFTDADLFIWNNNLNDAINFLKRKVKVSFINIIGLRLSATLAVLAVNDRRDIKELILVEPISSFITYLKSSLKQKLIKELFTIGVIANSREKIFDDLKNGNSIDFDGYEITQDLFKSFIKFDDKLELLKTCLNNKIRVIGISHVGKISKDIQRLNNAFRKEEFEIYEVLQLEHFWVKSDHVNCEVLIKTVLAIT